MPERDKKGPQARIRLHNFVAVLLKTAMCSNLFANVLFSQTRSSIEKQAFCQHSGAVSVSTQQGLSVDLKQQNPDCLVKTAVHSGHLKKILTCIFYAHIMLMFLGVVRQRESRMFRYRNVSAINM